MDEKQQDEFVETFGEELGEEIDIEATRKAHKMSMTGWALFFIWLGIVFSLNLGASVGMLGVGVITLGVQMARKMSGLQVEGFWVLVGVLLLLGSLGKLISFGIALIPLALILAGVIILWSVYFGKRARRNR